jgi:hypothetical protein
MNLHTAHMNCHRFPHTQPIAKHYVCGYVSRAACRKTSHINTGNNPFESVKKFTHLRTSLILLLTLQAASSSPIHNYFLSSTLLHSELHHTSFLISVCQNTNKLLTSHTDNVLGTTLINQSSIYEEIKDRLKSGNACYYSVQ